MTDGEMSIMYFFVKGLHVKSLALLFCASLMLDAGRCNLHDKFLGGRKRCTDEATPTPTCR